jgi:hypothetical protein
VEKDPIGAFTEETHTELYVRLSPSPPQGASSPFFAFRVSRFAFAVSFWFSFSLTWCDDHQEELLAEFNSLAVVYGLPSHRFPRPPTLDIRPSYTLPLRNTRALHIRVSLNTLHNERRCVAGPVRRVHRR